MIMPMRAVQRALAVAGVGLLALAGVLVPASAATSPPWRVVKAFSPAVGVWSDNLTAISARDSWSTWLACGTGSCGSIGPGTLYYVEHWSGTSWNRVRVPASLTGAAENSVALGASSFRDMWLIDSPRYPSATTRVLRWDGRKWYTQRIPAWAVYLNRSGSYNTTAAVFSPASVWIFNAGLNFAARYNGHTWTRMRMPGYATEVSVLSQHDIWALGRRASAPGLSTAQILMHWNGKSWHVVPVPQVRLPAGTDAYVGNLVALGPADAWVLRDEMRGTAGATTTGLLHWNGRSWSRVAVPSGVSIISDVTPDGHGGLWLAGNGPKPAYKWYLYHLDGKWRRYDVPTAKGTTLLDLTGLSWIPGTRSVWATANMLQPGANGKIIGAILKYHG
jgi:hypothetical protein